MYLISVEVKLFKIANLGILRLRKAREKWILIFENIFGYFISSSQPLLSSRSSNEVKKNHNEVLVFLSVFSCELLEKLLRDTPIVLSFHFNLNKFHLMQNEDVYCLKDSTASEKVVCLYMPNAKTKVGITRMIIYYSHI